MKKTETVEIQKELSGQGGKLAKYQDLILGEKGLFRLLRYELITGLAGRMPGALGLVMRSRLFPLLLGGTGRNVTFGAGVVLRHPRKIIIGDNVVVDDGCVLDAKGSDNRGITLGSGVFLGRNTILNCKNGDIMLGNNVNVGSNVTIFSASDVCVEADNLIAAYCYLVGGTHNYDDPGIPVLYQGRTSSGIRIGPGGWLGAHVTVFDGVRIGRNAVIGAGSVVNKDVPDYAVAAGIPAKVLKKRKPASARSKDASTRLMHSKKILYLSVYDPHVPYTGAGARGAQFVNFLAGRHEVDLVYMTGSGHPGNPELEEKFKDRLRGVGRVIRIPFTRRGYFIFSRALYNAASGLMREKRYDLILCDYGLSGRYGLKLSRKSGIPFVYASHNIEFRQYLGKAKSDPRRWPLVPYVRAFEKKAVKACSLLVAVSDEDKAFFSRWKSPARIVVVPQGFDESVFNPFYKPSLNHPKIVLFFGNYLISTNREAVRAVRDRIVDPVIEQMPDVVFRFAGANPPAEYGHPNFEFTGFVESLAGEIRKADAVISPMTGGWGMPTKVIESLACGKPVIATETGARSVPRRFSRLTVCSIDGFPEALVRVLRENRPVDGRDFESLKTEYLWSARLERLQAALEAPGGIGP
jgi:acetyltransferase-like isoleucine patch superfamily enzyme/glycosyltransferase involved in cell wall biosynthesis